MGSSDRRDAILAAATRLFEHYGHGKTTMADVAREANVGVGSVYLEFDSKDAIVAELSTSTHVRVLEAMRVAASKPNLDSGARLRAALVARTEAFVRLHRKGRHVCELVYCSATAVQTAHRHFHDEERALYERLLREGVSAGVFSEIVPARTAVLVQHAFACLAPPALFSAEEDVLELADELADLLLAGLFARPRARRTR